MAEQREERVVLRQRMKLDYIADEERPEAAAAAGLRLGRIGVRMEPSYEMGSSASQSKTR